MLVSQIGVFKLKELLSLTAIEKRFRSQTFNRIATGTQNFFHPFLHISVYLCIALLSSVWLCVAVYSPV